MPLNRQSQKATSQRAESQNDNGGDGGDDDYDDDNHDEHACYIFRCTSQPSALEIIINLYLQKKFKITRTEEMTTLKFKQANQ